MAGKGTKVCVTGGTGYIGSLIVKKLLERGYTVHATIRNLDDVSKVNALTSLPNADGNLLLFQANLWHPSDFEEAILGCDYVIHTVYPFTSSPPNLEMSKTDRTIDPFKFILKTCERSTTVKRFVYSASVLSTSPFREDYKSFRTQVVDESCWTPINDRLPDLPRIMTEYITVKKVEERELLSCMEKEGSKLEAASLACALVGGPTLTPHNSDSVDIVISPATSDHRLPDLRRIITEYITAKTMEERELLSCMEKEGSKLEVVSLACALVGGPTLTPHIPDSVNIVISPATGDDKYNLLFLQSVVGCVPLVHVEDVCDAHVLAIENPDMKGRFLCAAVSPKAKDIAAYLREHHPELPVEERFIGDDDGVRISYDCAKLKSLGFKFKYGLPEIMEDSLKCGISFGVLPAK